MIPNAEGKLSVLPTPTRSNHTFDGWFTAATGGEKVTTDTVFTQDTTIYAHWTAVSSGGSSRPTYPPTVTDTAGGDTRIRPASAFAPERAAYLVQPYLPRGMVSILGGVSAAGKTSLALDVCARLTRGAAFAPDTPPQPPATVLYLTAENDPNKVLRPRAEAMGADLDRLYFQDGASYSMGDEELAALCRVYRPALLVFDPIQSYLGQGVQMNRAEQVRPLLDHLGALAKELDMAVLLISHMSKPGPGVCSALDRLLGSSDFRNAARSILIAGRDPEHPEVRVVAHAKNSLGQPGESLPHLSAGHGGLRRPLYPYRRRHHPGGGHPRHRQWPSLCRPCQRHRGAGKAAVLCGLGRGGRGVPPVR